MIPRNYTNTSRLLCYFNTNGAFVKSDTISHLQNKFSSRHGIILDSQGHILCDMTTSEDLTFGHDLTLNFDDHQYSHAVIALRHDPSILEPYPEDSTWVVSYYELKNPIRLYPNPVANTLFIENEAAPIEHVVVLDMTGKEIFHQVILGNRDGINVSSLPDGMYMVKALCNGSFQINKFVKSKF